MYKDRIKMSGRGHKSLNAFTLAEVLITLAIIGVVSALVIPTVLKDYNDRKYNTARLKALKTFGEAGKLASINGEINGQPSARAFVENVLSKYLKVTKVCDTAQDCGFPSQIQPSNPSSSKMVSDNLKSWYSLNNNTKTKNNLTNLNGTQFNTYITTTDGYSAKLFYNPKCARNNFENPCGQCIKTGCWTCYSDDVCLNIIYDMNGNKGPNHIGEDLGFVTTFWSGLNTVSASPGILPYEINMKIYNSGDKTASQVIGLCESNGTHRTQYSLPNIYEAVSIVVNANLFPIPSSTNFWSGTPASEKVPFWGVDVYGNLFAEGALSPYRAWCVRR